MPEALIRIHSQDASEGEVRHQETKQALLNVSWTRDYGGKIAVPEAVLLFTRKMRAKAGVLNPSLRLPRRSLKLWLMEISPRRLVRKDGNCLFRTHVVYQETKKAILNVSWRHEPWDTKDGKCFFPPPFVETQTME
jgi:hypothetical protein